MLSGCTIVHTLVPFRMQEVEELCDTDFEFYFDFKVLADIYSINELPQDHLLTLDAASRIQVGPGHDLIILLLNNRNIIQKINLYGFWAVDDTVQNFYRNDDVSVKVLALD